jgi:hypothetical protein
MRNASPVGPYCLVFLQYGPILRIMKVPEAMIDHCKRYGWQVLVTDSEVFYQPPLDSNIQSNPIRHAQPDGYSDDSDGA